MAKKELQNVNEIKQVGKKLQDVSEIKMVRKPVVEDCQRCDGNGTIPNTMYANQKAPCPGCGGEGKVRIMKEV